MDQSEQPIAHEWQADHEEELDQASLTRLNVNEWAFADGLVITCNDGNTIAAKRRARLTGACPHPSHRARASAAARRPPSTAVPQRHIARHEIEVTQGAERWPPAERSSTPQ